MKKNRKIRILYLWPLAQSIFSAVFVLLHRACYIRECFNGHKRRQTTVTATVVTATSLGETFQFTIVSLHDNIPAGRQRSGSLRLRSMHWDWGTVSTEWNKTHSDSQSSFSQTVSLHSV